MLLYFQCFDVKYTCVLMLSAPAMLTPRFGGNVSVHASTIDCISTVHCTYAVEVCMFLRITLIFPLTYSTTSARVDAS